jgi:hypothetical protein
LVCALNVHLANIMDRYGVKLLPTESVRARLARMCHLWLDAGALLFASQTVVRGDRARTHIFCL